MRYFKCPYCGRTVRTHNIHQATCGSARCVKLNARNKHLNPGLRRKARAVNRIFNAMGTSRPVNPEGKRRKDAYAAKAVELTMSQQRFKEWFDASVAIGDDEPLGKSIPRVSVHYKAVGCYEGVG